MKVLTANYRTDVENSVNYANIATSNAELNELVAQLYGEMAAKQRQILEARGEGVSIRRSGADRAEKLKTAGFTSNSVGFVTPTGKVELSDVTEYSQHDGLHPVVGTTGKVTVTLF